MKSANQPAVTADQQGSATRAIDARNTFDALFGYAPSRKTFRQKISDQIERVPRQIKNLYYFLYGFIHPYNVIRIQNLPRGWTDRPHTFLHAAFQVLVDYVEREHTFAPWEKRDHLKGRYTDLAEMKEFVEREHGPAARAAMTDENDLAHAERRYPLEVEILALYEWYKTRQWELDLEANGYCNEAERAHVRTCDAMLHRLVECRMDFWS
jgi:hypothetical protein